jgi:hypothetical protein
MKLTSGLTAEAISPANHPVMELAIWQVTSKNPQLLLAAVSTAGAGTPDPGAAGPALVTVAAVTDMAAWAGLAAGAARGTAAAMAVPARAARTAAAASTAPRRARVRRGRGRAGARRSLIRRPGTSARSR